MHCTQWLIIIMFGSDDVEALKKTWSFKVFIVRSGEQPVSIHFIIIYFRGRRQCHDAKYSIRIQFAPVCLAFVLYCRAFLIHKVSTHHESYLIKKSKEIYGTLCDKIHWKVFTTIIFVSFVAENSNCVVSVRAGDDVLWCWERE